MASRNRRVNQALKRTLQPPHWLMGTIFLVRYEFQHIFFLNLTLCTPTSECIFSLLLSIYFFNNPTTRPNSPRFFTPPLLSRRLLSRSVLFTKQQSINLHGSWILQNHFGSLQSYLFLQDE